MGEPGLEPESVVKLPSVLAAMLPGSFTTEEVYLII